MYAYDGGNPHLNSLREKLGECAKCHGPLLKITKRGNKWCFLCWSYRQADPIDE